MGLGNEERISFGKYIEHTKGFLKLFRMWKTETDLSKWKNLLVTANTTVLLTSCFLLELSELAKLRSAPDLSRIASGIGSFWFHFLGFFKWFYFVWKVRAIMELVRELEDCYNLSLTISDEEEGSSKLKEEMNLAKKNITKFTYVWIVILIYGVVHWCLNPIFLQSRLSRTNTSFSEGERPLPYETWIPWDMTSETGYRYAFLFEFVGGFATAIGHVAYDVFYMTLVIMICVQFRYLNYVLEDQGGNDSKETSSGTKKKSSYRFLEEKLKRSKDYHCAILQFLSSLEEVTSPVMFVQCVGTMGILCLVSFEMMTMKLKGDTRNTIRVWSMLEYILGGFAQLFAFCYYADNVTTLGLKVGDSAYNCGWESSTSKSVGYMTQVIIARSQKPLRLTGGPFYVLSLETYRAVVSAAFSYSAVLREFG